MLNNLKVLLLSIWFVNLFAMVSSFAYDFEEEYEQAFKTFYYDDSIDSRGCGKNIRNFLNFLSQGISSEAKNAYVVSIHDDFADLHHFNARWGQKESYQNGEFFYRSNWYYHVFLLVNNRAYDFSQKDISSLPLSQYLEKSYLPKYRVKTFFGMVDRHTQLKKYLNLRMSIYPIESYKEGQNSAYYTGPFIELFQMAGLDISADPREGNIEHLPDYKKGSYGQFKRGEARNFIRASLDNSSGLFLYDKPIAEINGQTFPIRFRYKHDLCQALGHLGVFPGNFKKRELEVKMEPLVEISSSLHPDENQTLSAGIYTGFRYLANDQFWNYEVVEKLGCGDLKLALKLIP